TATAPSEAVHSYVCEARAVGRCFESLATRFLSLPSVADLAVAEAPLVARCSTALTMSHLLPPLVERTAAADGRLCLRYQHGARRWLCQACYMQSVAFLFL